MDSPETISLPLVRKGSRWFVRCGLGQGSVDALVSTGASSDVVVSETLASRAGWLNGSEKPLEWSEAWAVFLPKLELELGGRNYAASSAMAIRMDKVERIRGAAVDCTVGSGVLSRHQVEFDFKAGALRLHPLRSSPRFPYDRSQLLFVHLARGLPILRAGFGEGFGWLGWESAGEGFFFKDAFDSAFPGRSAALAFGARGPWTYAGVRRASALVRVGDLDFSGVDFARRREPAVRVEHARMRVVELPSWQQNLELGLSRPMAGFVGADLFGAERVLWDPGRGYLWRAPQRAASGDHPRRPKF